MTESNSYVISENQTEVLVSVVFVFVRSFRSGINRRRKCDWRRNQVMTLRLEFNNPDARINVGSASVNHRCVQTSCFFKFSFLC